MVNTAETLAVLALAGTILGHAGSAAADFDIDMKDVPLTLSGCVVAGEAKDSFVLTNVVLDGTTLAPVQAFYRFNTAKGLKDHVGRRVEVKGKVDLDDVDKGKVRTKVEDGKVTTEYSSERQTVRLEEAIRFGSPGSLKTTTEMATYKFDVESVKRTAGDCASSGAAR